MIKINGFNKEQGRLSADISITGKNADKLWFEYPKEFDAYVCDDNIDGVVVMMLYYAMKHRYDFVSELPISSKLKYQLCTYVIPTMAKNSGGVLKQIQIDAPVYTGERRASEPVHNATGLSCGIDSFYALYEHNYLINDERKRVDIVTYINHGSDNGQYRFSNEQIRDTYKKATAKFMRGGVPQEEHLSPLTIDSNIYEILDTMYGWDHTFRTAGVMLLFQREISNYYYAAGVDIKHFKYCVDKDSAYMDLFLLPMFSTERMTFYSEAIAVSRIEKTKALLNYPITRKYLHVCVNGDTNCGYCPKCTRTMITLYALDALEDYKEVFDVEAFYRNKTKILAWMLYYAKVEKESFAIDNVALLKEKGKAIPTTSRIQMQMIHAKVIVKKVLGMRK